MLEHFSNVMMSLIDVILPFCAQQGISTDWAIVGLSLVGPVMVVVLAYTIPLASTRPHGGITFVGLIFIILAMFSWVGNLTMMGKWRDANLQDCVAISQEVHVGEQVIPHAVWACRYRETKDGSWSEYKVRS